MKDGPHDDRGLGAPRFIAFFDECGDHSLGRIDPDFPLFVLALVVVERSVYQDQLLPAFNGFKLRYFDHEGINLHSRDIRVSSGPFLLLRNPVVRPRFLAELGDVMERSPFTLFLSGIRKQALSDLHGAQASNPYDLALEATLERLGRFLEMEGERRLPIVAEARGSKEDNSLEQAFHRIIAIGTPRFPAERFGSLDLSLSFQPKTNNIIGVQIADLCAHPCARHILAPDRPNRAFEAVRPKLYDREGVSGWQVFP